MNATDSSYKTWKYNSAHPVALHTVLNSHVIRLLQHQCIMAYRELSNKVKNNRGILALLRTRPDRLKPPKLIKRDAFLAEHPAIDAIYSFQQ